MRWALGLIALLLAMVTVLVLSSRQTERTFNTVHAIPRLAEDVAGRSFDESAARALVERLAALLPAASLPGEQLQSAAATAAAWAAGSTPGSREYRVAVKLRGAADALFASRNEPNHPQRAAAGRLISEARQALAGTGAATGPVDGLRDQLENLQSSQRERYQEIEGETK